MNWYKVVGVMDDGASIYGEEVIVAANSKKEASEKAKQVLCNNSEEIFRTDHVFDLDPKLAYVFSLRKKYSCLRLRNRL